MRSAEYYLKQLLIKYDCVTIPGLGGFVMHSYPATINRGKNRISPPARYPSFNILLSHDDGLLLSAIARAEGISYYDAGLIVSGFVESSKKKISLGENLLLEGIGELSPGPDGEIRFSPLDQVNFLAGAFGLEPLNIYPVKRIKPQGRLDQRHADRTARQLKERRPAAVRWTLALAIPVILFLLYGIIFPSSVQTIYTNYSGIIYDYFNADEQQPTVTETVKQEPVVEKTASEHLVAAMPDNEAKPVEKPEIITEPVVQQTTKYYIVGGCFENEENAGKFLAGLINRGFGAEKAGTNKSGHVRISYNSFPDKTSALLYLQKIRNEENPSAWLLKY